MLAFLQTYSREGAQDVVPVMSKPIGPTGPLPGLPVRLRIPSIQVDAAVEHLGLTTQGDLDAPKGYENAGWYAAGPRPGNVGNAVLDGHFGRAGNKLAVFDNLHTLQKGDRVYTEDENKRITTFIVRQLVTYNPDDDAHDVFSSRDGKSHLNLITCQGIWDKREASYSKRLVVFSDQVVE